MTPEVQDTTPRAVRMNPRALGTNPRSLGMNPRALGVSQREIMASLQTLGVRAAKRCMAHRVRLLCKYMQTWHAISKNLNVDS